MAAAGIGEASAVLAIVQFGISFAKTLTTYVGEYQNAEKDVRSLASEIEITYGQAEQLQGLLDENKSTNGFSDVMRINAEKHCLEAQELGEELWLLLGRSNVPRPKGRKVQKDDIHLALLDRALWPRFQPRVEEAQRKFAVLKSNVMIAIISYQAATRYAGLHKSDLDKKVDALEKDRQIALRELRAARKRRKAEKHVQFAPEPVDHARHMPHPERGQRHNPGAHHSEPLRYQHASPPYGGHHDADEESITSSLYNDIKDQILEMQEIEKAKEDEDAQREEELKQSVLDEYKTALVRDLNAKRQEAEQARKRLSKAFGLPVDAKQVVQFVRDGQARELKSTEIGKLLHEFGSQPESENGITRSTSRHWSWNKRGRDDRGKPISSATLFTH